MIAGLGNPGRRYAGTRHNVGFEVLDTLAARHRLDWQSSPAEALTARWRTMDVLLAKPLTFMNLSGHAVGELLRYYKVPLEDLLVIVDEVNLELGRLRARARGSAGGHNGLRSLIEQLGTMNFARLRVGVGRGDGRGDLADHVLATFDAAERPIIDEAVGRAGEAAQLFVTDGIAAVMNRYNRKEDAENQKEDGD